jgi:hypothetical protein
MVRPLGQGAVRPPPGFGVNGARPPPPPYPGTRPPPPQYPSGAGQPFLPPTEFPPLTRPSADVGVPQGFAVGANHRPPPPFGPAMAAPSSYAEVVAGNRAAARSFPAAASHRTTVNQADARSNKTSKTVPSQFRVIKS